MNGNDDGTGDAHRFPGGRPRLPRLSRPAGANPFDPRLSTTDEDLERDAEDDEIRESDGSFTDYFSTESLFGASPPRDQRDEAMALGPGGDAYSVLGVDRRASWKEISRAHRTLVSQLHPDRYVDADEDTRAAAERRVRDVNAAFSEIRRHRQPSAC